MSKIVARNGAIDLDKSAIDYETVQDPGHGNTLAAWMTVFIMLLGAVVATVGNIFGSWMIFWVGIVIALIVGPGVGLVLRAMGKGKPKDSGRSK
ncbi:hypothetical protein GCM10022261_29720 [Brevibacterium daeguense]|uniref:DUF2207 domain-containing protein n=1 Tax=Brevibacterium daeguense TaxID=909936 RepID=A0ABP8EN66_9MICO|nr:SNG1 family protein [Brevibacterium daeguense]